MTILVDPAQDYGDIARAKALRWTTWCHMVSDESEDELHRFAARVGLRRSWYHNGHYNLTAGRRRVAVDAGAVEVSARDLVKRNCLGMLRQLSSGKGKDDDPNAIGS